MKIISACLVGVECRFDGGTRASATWKRLAAQGGFVPVCPEQLGGLPTPRSPAEIESGGGEEVLDGKTRVVDVLGVDRTAEHVHGAREVLRIARLVGATEAILKERSPSCGCKTLRRGGRTIEGKGVTAALLEREGIRLVSDEEGL
ncbi:MAG: DUF523 domain-containing protein [Candidatus Eisenbacteria bacterium]